ncbi:MAG: type II secretion system protein [Candidatus Brocadiia bacterium]
MKNYQTVQVFTLIELLIVIGLLGALATLVLPSFRVQREESLEKIVKKEMADVQKAFQRFQADCVPQTSDYNLISRYGLEILAEYDDSRGWTFPDEWDPDRGKGWRGPYLQAEGTETVDDSATGGLPDDPGQPMDDNDTDIPVVYTPFEDDSDGQPGDYYRVIPELNDTEDEIKTLWLVFPSHSGELPDDPDDPDSYDLKKQLWRQ